MRIRKFTKVKCIECRREWQKREDTLKQWLGRCRSCAMRLLENSPERKMIKINNGVKFIEKYGKIPNARTFTSENMTGEKHWNWAGGVTPFRTAIYQSKEYRDWRSSVFKRDEYTCQMCGCRKSGELQADHIKPFAIFVELRFDVSNGRTLCVRCHRKYGAMARGGRVTREAILSVNTAH